MFKNKSSLIIVGLLIGLGLIFFLQKPALTQATVSGTVNFNRLKPDQGDKGNIFILARPYQSGAAFNETGAITELKDDVTWNWDKSEKGKNYEIQAQLRIDGKVVKSSEVVVVTAPAKEVLLTLPVTWDDLPDYIVKEQKVTMGGKINVNGYVPDGSVLSVEAKTPEMSFYEFKWSSDNAQLTNTWEWTEATPKTKYQMKAVLMNTGEVIGESSVVDIEGVKTDEVYFSLTSKAKYNEPTPAPENTPIPTKQTSIKGYLTVNGPEDVNTSALIMWSVPGQNNWQEIRRIQNPKNGNQTWEWNGAKTGVSYEIGISLQVNNQTTATTQNKIVTAPATDVNFTLNTGVNVPVPNNKPALQSCTNNTNSQWDANLTIPVNAQYGNYWTQVGSTMGGVELYNNKLKPPTNDSLVRITVRVNDRQTYYSRYGYSFCFDCSSDVNFSNFSDSLVFSCGAQAPTATPIPTLTPVPTLIPTSTPAPTSTPTLPPNTAACNETCGSNGYRCVLGLECVSTDVPGQSACRNPNCTDRTNCNCL